MSKEIPISFSPVSMDLLGKSHIKVTSINFHNSDHTTMINFGVQEEDQVSRLYLTCEQVQSMGIINLDKLRDYIKGK